MSETVESFASVAGLSFGYPCPAGVLYTWRRSFSDLLNRNADGDSYFVNGFYAAGATGGQLTSNLSGTHSWGQGTFTPKAWTHITVNGTAYNDDVSGSFQVISP